MFKKTLLVMALILPVLLAYAPGASAVQVQLPGSSIPQFVDPLPLLDIQGGPIATAVFPDTTAAPLEIRMREFKANVMPSTFVPAWGSYNGTTVWGYRMGAAPAGVQGTYTGPVLVTQRGTPTRVKFINNLGTTYSSQLPFWKTAVDQTLHWADPLNGEANQCKMDVQPGLPPMGDCAQSYIGLIPAVPHLHGGEVPPVLDGDPDQWFLSAAPNLANYPSAKVHGHTYYSQDKTPSGNYSIFRYPNSQEAGPLWFHDHLLGGTRLNVYAGLAGGYLLQDPLNPPPADLDNPALIIPMVVQDRMFDTRGELFFPSSGINPEHPYWIPEFVGDTICVNGKVWPYLDVEAKLYRVLFINGSNARPYNITLDNATAAMYQIETDGGYLDAPVDVTSGLTLMTGERAGVIIDFRGVAPGTNVLLKNDANTPYPGGTPVAVGTEDRIIQFRVKENGTTTTPTLVNFDPADVPAPAIRTTNPIVRLPGTPAGPAVVKANIPSRNVWRTRLLTLNEVMGAGGPLEVLVNNTGYMGLSSDTTTYPGGVRPDFTAHTVRGVTDYLSEIPAEGTTEIWEIVNLTADAHPIHLHLVQFQLLSRQDFDVAGYDTLYQSLFPGGAFVPGFGPPLNYKAGNANALGGNPDVTPFLLNTPTGPDANELGWKDTVRMMPGQVTRIVVRFAPTDKAVGAPDMYYPFNPAAGGRAYVWHCHIVDHEDNEMMRHLFVNPKAGAIRSFVMGIDF
ncbi:MAG: multicopper oxidase domain-containing protein [Nitrospirae bacterium]|nr:multicopper oxidase domain-containing protein [Nitrospirota bacterium]